MKTSILGLLGSLLLTFNAYGQFKIPIDSSFYTFLDSFYYYHQDDSTEGGMYNQVRRDAMTWGPRLAPTGKMTTANKAMLQYSRVYNASGTNVNTINLGVTPVVFPPTHPNNLAWDELGPTQPVLGGSVGKGMGQIHRVAFHPQYDGSNNQVIYAGSHYGGLYRTDDGGSNWYNYHTDRGLPMTSIGGIATSNDKVFVVTGNGDQGYANFGANAWYHTLGPGSINGANPVHTQGVYWNTHQNPQAQWVSINGSGSNAVTMLDGTTRQDLLEVFEIGGTMRNIIVHPTNENILFIATSQGIFKTSNRGVSWQQVLIGANASGGQLLDSEWRGLAFHPVNPNIVYASGRSVAQSIDGGNTWTVIANAHNYPTVFPSHIDVERINIAVTPNAPNLLYAYIVGKIGTDDRQGAVLIYNKSTMTWSMLSLITDSGVVASYSPSWIGIAVSPLDSNKVFVGYTKIWGTYDAFQGGNWGARSYYYDTLSHADVHALTFPPNQDDFLYAGTHGGVSKKDMTNTGIWGWTPLYNGLGVATIWAFDDWSGNDSVMIMANQDVGIHRSIDYGNSWISDYFDGDGYGARIDNQTGKAYLKYNNYRGVYKIYPDYEVFESRYLSTPPSSNLWVPNTFPLENHPKTDLVYLGFSELFERKTCELPSNYYDTVRYNSRIERIRGAKMDSLGNIFIPPLWQTCQGQGGVILGIDTVPTPNNLSWDFRIDTICCLAPANLPDCIDTVYGKYLNIPADSARSYLWDTESNLETDQPNAWDRRIMEIAFSEDRQTDYTYLATAFAANANRQSDFYFRDIDTMCGTCFVSRSSALPVDTSIPAALTSPNPVTGIAVDPLDGNRVWVSFSGYSRMIKVYYSEDAGLTWTTYDDTLGALAALNVPINDIVYQRGTKDRLYIATDVGVYVRENGGNWLRYGENFPNVRTVELTINYCKGKLRAATFGRGAWENDLLPPENDLNYRSFRLITGNEVWDKDKHMSRDIHIDSGAVLTLDAMTLNMPKDGFIVVEQGGKLIVNHSTITNLCSETWRGIQVWGNTYQIQDNVHQGLIVLNGATIEYAKNAISPWQVGNYPSLKTLSGGTGGMIKAINSTFLNNWRSADFMKYVSPIGVKELSSFVNCTFEVNDDFRPFDGKTTQSLLGHVSMWHVTGTRIEGCTFKDTRSNRATNPDLDDIYGLYLLEASPHITAAPVGNSFPPSSFKRNVFEGLERAIEIGNGGLGGTVIDQCDFINNEQGVIVQAQNLVQVTRNDFEIGGYPNQNSNNFFVEEYGLGVIGSTGFTVEQNSFAKNSPDLAVGSWIEDAGSDPIAIRNNNYQSITVGNVAHGVNKGVLPEDGLQYHCNENQGNGFDFVVYPNIATNMAPASISNQQGSIVQASRNTLSSVNGTVNQFYNYSTDLLGQLNPPVIYYYSNTQQNEVPDTSLVFNLNRQDISVGNQNFCQDNYTNGSSSNLINSLNGKVLELSNVKTKYYEAHANYSMLKQQHKDLLGEGNSNESVSETFECKTLEGQMGLKYLEVFFWANQVIKAYAKDSISNLDSIKVWINHKTGLAAHYELVNLYWYQGHYQEALAVLQDIPNRFELTEREEENHTLFNNIKNLLYSAYESGRTEANLEQNEVAVLAEIAELKVGFASVYAGNILRFFYGLVPAYYPTIPDLYPFQGKIEQFNDLQESAPLKPRLRGYPNPAHTWTNVLYDLPEETTGGKIVVTSTVGQVLHQQNIKERQGTLNFNTSQWIPGIYFVTLITNKEELVTYLLVVQR